MIAIIDKEWRRILRSPGTPWTLLAYILLPLAIAALAVKSATSVSQMPGQPFQNLLPLVGAQALSTVGTWQIMLLAVLAPWLSAGLLANELEERTLDSMLAAGQRIVGVVAAKLAAAILFMWLVVLAGLPVFTLPMTIGGTNWALLGRILLLELAVATVMVTLGLVLSSFGRKLGSVAVTGVALGLAITVGSSVAATSAGAGGVYTEEQRMMMLKMGGMPVQGQMGGEIPKWLYANPLVGLNTALNQPTNTAAPNPTAGLVGSVGIGAKPVYKEFRLWQIQIAGAGALALVGALVAWVAMIVRLRWRWPALGRKARKGVAAHG